MSDVLERLNDALSGRYVVDRKLGEGGMAVVYLAHDMKHEQKVALKVLKPELAAVVGAERFLAEIKTTAHLQHRHICRSSIRARPPGSCTTSCPKGGHRGFNLSDHSR